MPAFQYFAVDQTGAHVRGRMDAANENDLEQRLRRMGLDLVNSRAKRGAPIVSLAKRISRQDLINFCFHLEQISRSGIPLLDGLAVLAESTDNKRFREVISAMHEDMEGGKLLSQAMAQHPAGFDQLFTSLIRTGEQTGNMQEVLRALREQVLSAGGIANFATRIPALWEELTGSFRTDMTLEEILSLASLAQDTN